MSASEQQVVASQQDNDNELELSLGQKLQGKYMTFKLADEAYGIEILSVREIIRMMDMTRVPRTPDFISGVINLRGKVITVIDLRMKFGMKSIDATDQTVIIVVQIKTESSELTMGLLVDEVLEVRSVAAEAIEPAPMLGGGGVDIEFIQGVGKLESRVIFLLNIGKILSSQELEQAAAVAK